MISVQGAMMMLLVSRSKFSQRLRNELRPRVLLGGNRACAQHQANHEKRR